MNIERTTGMQITTIMKTSVNRAEIGYYAEPFHMI
jgi:hypothetical protein